MGLNLYRNLPFVKCVRFSRVDAFFEAHGQVGVWFIHMFMTQFCGAPVFVIWLYALSKSKKSLSSRFLNSSLLQYFGKLSYSMYCINAPILQMFCWLKTKSFTPLSPSSLVGGLNVLDTYEVVSVLCLIIGFSQLIFHWIEQPARDWLCKQFEAPQKVID